MHQCIQIIASQLSLTIITAFATIRRFCQMVVITTNTQMEQLFLILCPLQPL